MSGQSGDNPDVLAARTWLRPEVQAALTAKSFWVSAGIEDVNIDAVIAQLWVQIKEIREGDLRRVEAMLIGQAHALDAIFGDLARRAAASLPASPKSAEFYLRLAFKAQTQCRTTLEALSLVKNPSGVSFVRQQNVAMNQQVNNGSPALPARARESRSKPTKLLEEGNARNMDVGAQGKTARGDPNASTVGEIYGATDTGRKDPLESQPL